MSGDILRAIAHNHKCGDSSVRCHTYRVKVLKYCASARGRTVRESCRQTRGPGARGNKSGCPIGDGGDAGARPSRHVKGPGAKLLLPGPVLLASETLFISCSPSHRHAGHCGDSGR